MGQLLRRNYFFSFAAILSLLFLSNCEKSYDSVIDSEVSAPIISDAKFSLDKVYTDTIYNNSGVKNPNDILTIRGNASVAISQNNGTMNIALVRFSLIADQSSSLLSEGILVNDGVFPDQTSSDSIYSRSIEFQIERVFVGKMTLSIWSESKLGSSSNIALLPLEIIRRDNHAPFLSNLIMDSVIVKSDEDQFLRLKITASDIDGRQDILKVYFNSFKPGGSPSVGNPFQMYDDGNENLLSGDMVPGDGIYGIIIRLPVSAALGTYRFEFHAIDRSLDSSNVIIKNLVVTN